ncbi:hypothetical protein [Methylosinus sp. PW1]|uniref:hypothetical protein n=1 Tax=Methylosinus sp. PW1 TaxID=107636 RepID=UPI00055FA1BD|nr:hypothetical protein [Methylosinus sp. PW1]
MSKFIPAIGKKPPVKIAGPKWRNSRQIRGYLAHVKFAITHSDDGSTVTLDLKIAEALKEICEQAIHTEEGHGS